MAGLTLPRLALPRLALTGLTLPRLPLARALLFHRAHVLSFSFLPRPHFAGPESPPPLARVTAARLPGLAQRDGDGLLPLPDLATGRRAERAPLVLPHDLLDLPTAFPCLRHHWWISPSSAIVATCSPDEASARS